MTVGALLGATYAFFRKRVQAVADGSAVSNHSVDHGHVEFEPLRNKLMTIFNWVLLLLMAFGGVSLVARFAVGLGGSTHLSNTYPWGLWILFDLVWIAVAAGAFAMAGVIYVFQRKDLYGLGRTAVLTGLLSYSFVTVTLIADLGLPWHFYQLGLQAPEHSAMFEVSWCVGLYVTILLLEFLPVPFERWGFQRAMVAWRRWNGVYVAAAVTLFVYMLSRSLTYALATAVIFGALAWIFRARDETAEPIMLAIAAVTLSTMHQSSLGSLYLLMPNMLAPQWWSPVMPVSFFLSSIVAGTALVILIDMWIAKGWRRALEITRLASVGQITFWALLAYLVFRLGDMALRSQFSGAFAGMLGLAFAGLIPFSQREWRSHSVPAVGLAVAIAIATAILTRGGPTSGGSGSGSCALIAHYRGGTYDGLTVKVAPEMGRRLGTASLPSCEGGGSQTLRVAAIKGVSPAVALTRYFTLAMSALGTNLLPPRPSIRQLTSTSLSPTRMLLDLNHALIAE